MLGKLLSFLNRSKSQSPGESLPNSQIGINVENLVSLNEVPVSVLNKLFIFSVLLTTVFILLTFVNQGFKTALDAQKQEQTKLINDLQNLESKQNLVISLDKKIKFYQNFLQSKKSLADKSAFIMDHVNPDLTTKSGEVSDSEFKISLTGKNIYLFTQLIMQYLEGDKVSELSITSANFDVHKDEFTVDLKGVFK